MSVKNSQIALFVRVHGYSVGIISSMEHVTECLEVLGLTSVKASDIVRVSDAEGIACGIKPDDELSKCIIFVLSYYYMECLTAC